MRINFLLVSFLTIQLICNCAFTIKAQPSAPALATPVSIDLKKQTIGEIPFDKSFYFTGDIETKWNINKIIIEIKKNRKIDSAESKKNRKIDSLVVGGKTHFIIIGGAFEKDFLLPDREYTITVTCKASDETIIDMYSFSWGLLAQSSIGDHTKLDFGISYSSTPKAFIGYTSVNIYFTPINDETNLSMIKNVSRNIFLRTSIFIGISPITFSSDTKQDLKNKYGVGNLVCGIAIRSPFYGCYTKGIGKVGQKLLQPMRLSFGEMLYAQVNANPLITKKANKAAFFMGLSYDLNIAKLLGPISKIIAP